MSNTYLLPHYDPELWYKVSMLVSKRKITIKDLILKLLREEVEKDEKEGE